MLVAAERAKLKRKLALWEDEVTSIVFGPLMHMPVLDVWHFLKKIAISAGIREPHFPATLPAAHCLKFWPTHTHITDGAIPLRVEPDVVVEFNLPDGAVFRVLLEVKWGGGLSPKCELVRQWLTRPAPQERWIHLYVVSSHDFGINEAKASLQILSEGCKDLSCCDKNPARFTSPGNRVEEFRVWKSKLAVTSWRHIQHETQRLASEANGGAFGCWARGVTAFLENQQYIPFIGFSLLAEPTFSVLEEEVSGEFFVREEWFAFLGENDLSILEDTFADNTTMGEPYAG